jgi:hypothetical protein
MKKFNLCFSLTAAFLVSLCVNAQLESNDSLMYSKSRAVKEARLTAALYRKMYNGTNAMEQALYNLYCLKEDELQAAYKKYTNAVDLDNKITAVIRKYDSIGFSLLHAARGHAFFERKIEYLNSVKALSSTEIASLRAFFTGACVKSSDKSYSDNFMEAMHRYIRDTIYYARLYNKEIDFKSMLNARKENDDLMRKYKITPAARSVIVDLVTEKQRSLITIDYTFPVFTTVKQVLLDNANIYFDSLINLALMKDGSFPRTSQFSIAIKNRAQIGLSANQVDTLYIYAVMLEKLIKQALDKDPSRPFNALSFEVDNMVKILTEEQYMRVLNIKNKRQAFNWAQSDWQELKQRGLTEGLDSTIAIYTIAEYNTARLSIKDRYVNDQEKMNKYIGDLDINNRPAAMIRLKAARNRDKKRSADDSN